MRVMRVEGMSADEVTYDDAIDAVCGGGSEGGELLVECGGYFFVICELSVGECDGLIGGVWGSLPVESPKKRPEV